MEEAFRNFATLITGIYRNIRRIKSEAMAEFNLKSHHVSSIYYLYRAKTMTAAELSEVSGEDKANISRIITYLEKHGYLTRDTANQKRYKVALSLTVKGREVGKRMADKLDSILREVNRGLSEEAQKELFRCLSLIEKNLAEISDANG